MGAVERGPAAQAGAGLNGVGKAAFKAVGAGLCAGVAAGAGKDAAMLHDGQAGAAAVDGEGGGHWSAPPVFRSKAKQVGWPSGP